MEFCFAVFMRCLWWLNQPQTKTIKEDLRATNQLNRLRRKPTVAEFHVVVMTPGPREVTVRTGDGDGTGMTKGEHNVRGTGGITALAYLSGYASTRGVKDRAALSEPATPSRPPDCKVL
jgi:hypothetical protein